MAARILADSKGASKRFGFDVDPTKPIKTAPKLTEQWFIEFIDTNDKLKDISAQAQSVSPITIQTTTQPIDRYGKREYIPTRVDFPEVTVTLYDTIDGKTMTFAQDIYAQFFKNAGLSVGAGTSTIEDINSGRHIPLSVKTESHKNFDRVTVYHFFGSFADGGTGTIQRIVLINPIVTSIVFSESDYASDSLRTITISLQPENIIFGTPEKDVANPRWIQNSEPETRDSLGVDYSQTQQEKNRNDLGSADIPTPSVFEGPTNEQLGSLTTAPPGTTTKRRPLSEEEKVNLRELQRSKRALDAVNNNPDATDEEKEAALERWQEAKRNSPIVSTNPNTTELPVGMPVDTSKDSSLSGQQLAAHGIRDNAMGVETRPEVDTAPPQENIRTYNESYSGRNIGGEPYVPGKPMSDVQIAATSASIAMGNEVPPSVMADYNAGLERQQAETQRTTPVESTTPEQQEEAQRTTSQEEIDNVKSQTEPKTQTTGSGNGGKVQGLMISNQLRETEDYKQFLQPPRTNSRASQRAAYRQADARYRNAVIAGQVEPPDYAKGDNYRIIRD